MDGLRIRWQDYYNHRRPPFRVALPAAGGPCVYRNFVDPVQVEELPARYLCSSNAFGQRCNPRNFLPLNTCINEK